MEEELEKGRRRKGEEKKTKITRSRRRGGEEKENQKRSRTEGHLYFRKWVTVSTTMVF